MTQTCDALATKAELKEKANQSDLLPLISGVSIATVSAEIAKDLANGNASWINIKGARVAQQLPTLVAKTSAADAKAAKASLDAALAGRQASRALSTGTTALSKAGQALGAIGGILGIISTLASAAALAALTKQLVDLRTKFNQYRIDTDKWIGELQHIAKSAQATNENQAKEIEQLNQQIADNRRQINDALYQAELNRVQIEGLKAENAAIRSNLNTRIDNLTQMLVAKEQSLREAIERQRINNISNTTEIARLNRDIQNANERQNILNTVNAIEVARLNGNLTNLINTTNGVTNQVNTNTNAISQLQATGGGSGVSPEQLEEQITEQLDLRLPELIENFMPDNTEQLTRIEDNLGLILPGALLAPQIYDRVSPENLRQNTEDAICNSTNGGCLQNNVRDPIINNQNSNSNFLLGAINGVGQAFDLSLLQVINNKLGEQLPGGISGYFKKAWEFTKMDKVLNVLNLAVNLHNATMLSRNIGETLGEAVSNALSFIGIKDAEGNAIDVNELISQGVTNLITSIIGTENYEALLTKWAKVNRIYQTGMNLLSNIQSVLGSMEEIAEQTGVEVAQIGNALRDSGVVEADSYGHMAENKRGLIKLFDALEKGEEFADTVLNITENVRDIQEEAEDFRENQEAIREEFKKEEKEIERIEEVADRRIENLPEPTEQDKLEGSDN